MRFNTETYVGILSQALRPFDGPPVIFTVHVKAREKIATPEKSIPKYVLVLNRVENPAGMQKVSKHYFFR